MLIVDKKLLILGVIVVFLMATKCVSSNDGGTINRISIATQSMPSTPHASTTLTILPFVTSAPPLTAVIPLKSPVTSKTKTPFPTVSSTEAESRFLELLHPSTYCLLPCWWGINPGYSKVEDIQKFSDILHINAKDYTLFSDISFFDDQNIITHISIEVDGFYNPAAFKAIWEEYTPEQIVIEYGQPTRIWLDNFYDQTGPPYASPRDYGLWLFYDTLGFVIIYEGQVEIKPNYQICPTFDANGNLLPYVGIFLQSPYSQIPLEDFVGEYGGIRSSILSLEDAIGVTNQKFYERFIQSKDGSVCFDTPQEIWPP